VLRREQAERALVVLGEHREGAHPLQELREVEHLGALVLVRSEGRSAVHPRRALGNHRHDPDDHRCIHALLLA
jgi:hypothetical protein